MDALERVLERRAVRLVEHVAADLDHVVGAHAEHERVERAVVDRAHGDPVGDDRLTALGILLDVRRVQGLAVAQAAEGALGPVGREHLTAEDRLVQPLADGALGVLAPAEEVLAPVPSTFDDECRRPPLS